MAGLRRQSDPIVAAAAERISLARLFVQDFRPTDDDQEEIAARERARALDHVPFFLLGVHLICGAALLFELGGHALPPLGLLAPLSVLGALDVGLWGWSLRRPLSRVTPHVALRGAALYAIVANALWAAAAIAVQPAQSPDLTLLDIAVAGGVLAIPLAFLSFPALVTIGCIGFVAKLAFISHDPLGAAATGCLSLLLIHLSLRRSADRLAQLKRRILIDWNAQRAGRFIDEFEQAGRGWFWETTARGALSYVSEQLAADLKTPADQLIGKPFADLIGLDDRRGAEPRSGPWASTSPRACPSPTSTCAPTPLPKSGGRCRARRASTNMAASSAFAASAPISPSSAAPRRRSTGSPNMIR